MLKKASMIIFSFIVQILLICPIFAKGWVTVDGNWKYETESGEYLADEILKSGEDKFYLDQNGNLAMNYLYDNGDSIYYFDTEGKMVAETWVAIDYSKVDDPPFDADLYYYYFGNNCKAVKSDSGKIRNIDGKSYMFNDRGIMLVGWISENGDVIDAEDGDDWYGSESVYYANPDGTLCEGWLPVSSHYRHEEYTNAGGDLLTPDYLYFYFDPRTHKKVEGHERTINGKKYAFQSENGHMYTSWEYLEEQYQNDFESITSDVEHNISLHSEFNKFYSDANDGSLAKNKWIYEVPSAVIDSKKFNDEEKEWFYVGGNGTLVTDQIKKIDGKKYLFDKRGIMRKGLIVLKDDKYQATIDLDRTSYDDLVKNYRYYQESTRDFSVEHIENDDESSMSTHLYDDCRNNFYLMERYTIPKGCIGTEAGEMGTLDVNRKTGVNGCSIRYFGDDGALVVGDKIKVEFSDGIHEFTQNHKGGFYEWHNNKYYVNGFLMKANKGEKIGVFCDFFNCTKNGVAGITYQSQFHPKLVKYGGSVLFDLVGNSGLISQPADAFESAFSANGYPKWYAYLPIGRLYYQKGKNDTSGTQSFYELGGNSGTGNAVKNILQEVTTNITTNYGPMDISEGFSAIRTGDIMFLVDESGKIKDKGVYSDGDGYYVIEKEKKFVGYFTVPCKWKKVDGIDTPHYKSDLKTYDSEGREVIKTNQWIPFGTKDAHGFTEVNYADAFPNDACLNFNLGSYMPFN